MKDNICDVFLAIRFETAPTKTKGKQEWVRVADDTVKHIKRIARIKQDDFWNAYNTLMAGGIYQVGQNQYKLFKEKEKKNASI